MSLNDWVGLVGGLILIVGTIIGIVMWYVRVVVRDEVRKATQPIQPGYRNGGESLADVAANVKRILDKMGMEQ